MARFEEKVALVLGASDPAGIGAATARRLAADGAQVVVAARRADGIAALAREIGGHAIACDITEESSVAALADGAIGKYGRLDIAINCAGANAGGAIEDITEADFLPQARLHLFGTAYFIKHMARCMTAGGSILTTSSVTAFHAGPGLAVYSSTKAGADQIVRVAAAEYGSAGIRVNAIAPGFTRSGITEAYFEYGTMIDAFVRETPLGRLGTVDDIAAAMAWYSSDECFATGQIVQINGGNTLRRIPTQAEMFPG